MTVMKEYKAYLFDLYGTLVDIHTDEYRPSFWKKMCGVFAEHGVRHEWSRLRDAYFREVADMEEEKKEPGHHIEIDLKTVFEKLLQTEDAVTARKAMEKFRDLSTTHLRLYAGGKDLLRYLKENGKTVVLLSNAQKVFTLRELEHLGIRDLFDRIFISSSVGYKKPDPAFFQHALKECGLKAEDCLMIGNDPFCDVEGAKGLGIDTCYIRSALSPEEEKEVRATYVLDRMDLRKLKRMIRKFDFNEK
jgi:putative hydrolase of the HAD superfamily